MIFSWTKKSKNQKIKNQHLEHEKETLAKPFSYKKKIKNQIKSIIKYNVFLLDQGILVMTTTIQNDVPTR